jgi:hypothetical protein
MASLDQDIVGAVPGEPDPGEDVAEVAPDVVAVEVEVMLPRPGGSLAGEAGDEARDRGLPLGADARAVQAAVPDVVLDVEGARERGEVGIEGRLVVPLLRRKMRGGGLLPWRSVPALSARARPSRS